MPPQPAKSIVIGADHAGFALKQRVVEHLQTQGITVHDVGCFSEERVDYPDIAGEVINTMRVKQLPHAIIVCGSGIGVGIAANRYRGIRAVTANDIITARLSRLHNNANVLCLGGRIIAPELAFEITDTWLETPFEGGRHENRICLLDSLGHKDSSATGETSQQCSI